MRDGSTPRIAHTFVVEGEAGVAAPLFDVTAPRLRDCYEL